MMKPRISLFAEHKREVLRTTIGDPLVGLTKHVDFEALAAGIGPAAIDSSSIPDAKTIWLFRDRLAQAGVGNQIFEQVQQQLQQHGYMARCGQIVDALLVQAPVQRNKREEADTVKAGTMPLGWKPHKRA